MFISSSKPIRPISNQDFIPEILLQKGGRQIQFEANQTIDADLLDSGLIFITYGIVKSYATEQNGNEIFIDLLKRGDIFGSIQQTNAEFHIAAKAMTKCMAIYIHQEELQYFYDTDQNISSYINKLFRDKAQKLETRYLSNVSKDIKTRLQAFFKNYALEFGSKKTDDFVIQNHLSHQEIAQLLNSSRQTISVILNQWRDQNLLSYSRKVIRLHDLPFFDLNN
ncbi:Crp/Fnr family transcriptional regulator [Peijinzhouia sedimentorum]